MKKKATAQPCTELRTGLENVEEKMTHFQYCKIVFHPKKVFNCLGQAPLLGYTGTGIHHLETD